MAEVVAQFLGWYLIVQIVTVAALPLALRTFRFLPDRGYAFARILGVLLVGFLLWIGTSYGLLRNDRGGAWLAVLLVGLLSGWATLGQTGPGQFPGVGPRLARLRGTLPGWRYIAGVELLFLLAFAAWAWVRAHDPAINHTEQPMDLMFMSGIWTSAEFPPRDPWLSGYAISYYYFGYWLLMTLARLAGQTPEVAYNLGQACWFGLLLTGGFGIGANLFAAAGREKAAPAQAIPAAIPAATPAVAPGLLTAAAVGLTGNLHVILEWLYAQGVNLAPLIRWVDVYNFPEAAQQTGNWYIDAGWSWWWRASRVIEDTDLLGNHIEIIDEFPIFSYILGDNHPHLLAMPIVLLVVALALNWWLGGTAGANRTERTLLPALPIPQFLLLLVASGGLVFLNTWDFPPYWALLVLVALFLGGQRAGWGAGLRQAGLCAGLLLLGTAAVYFPYFLTAQSQAGGIVPNLFFPTRLPQFLLMFGHFLLGVSGLLILAWREQPPSLAVLGTSAGLVLGVPAVFLLVTGTLAVQTDFGQELLARTPLPPGADGYGELILQRRLGQPGTFLLTGGLSALALALLWQRLAVPGRAAPPTTFALFLVAIGGLLTFTPEFVYLRDNFGTRMNTVFKFYYQSWLLLGVAAAYAIALSGQQLAGGRRRAAAGRNTAQKAVSPIAHYSSLITSTLALLLILAGLIYPVAGAYAKITGFGTKQPTFDGLAYVGPDEQALIEWIRNNTAADAVILEARGFSYRADLARISASTGRATLLGWDGHEAQWRGDAYGEMAAGRAEAAQEIYQRPDPATLRDLLDRWQIDYVLVGPAERAQYDISPQLEERLGQVLDVAFEQGAYRLFRAGGR